MSEVKDPPKDAINWPIGVVPPEGAVTGNTVAEVVDKADDNPEYAGYAIDDFVLYDPERKTYYLDEQSLNHRIKFSRFRAQARIDCGINPTEECLTQNQIEQIGKDIEDNRKKYDESIAALQASLQPFQDTMANDPMVKMGLMVAGGLAGGLVVGLGIQSIGHGPAEDAWNVLRKKFRYLQEYYVQAELNKKYTDKTTTPQQREALKNCGFDFSNLPKNTVALIKQHALKAVAALTAVMMGVAALGYGANQLLSSEDEIASDGTEPDVSSATSGSTLPMATPRDISLIELLAQNEATLDTLSGKTNEAEDLSGIVKEIRMNLTSGNPEEARRLYKDGKTGFKTFTEEDFKDPQVLALYRQYVALFEQVFSLSDDDLKNRSGQTSWGMTLAGLGAAGFGFMFMQGSTAEKVMDSVYSQYRSLRFRAGVQDIESYLDDVVKDAWTQANLNAATGGQCTDVALRLEDFEMVYGLQSPFNPHQPAPFPLPKPVTADGEEEDAADPTATPVIAPNAAPAFGMAVPGAQSVLSSAATYVSDVGARLPRPSFGNALLLQGASNSAGGNVSGRGGVPETNASFRVLNNNAEPLPGWVRKPGGGAEYNPEKAAEIKAAKPKPGAPVEAPITPRNVVKAGAGMALTTGAVVLGEIYLDKKLDELGVPEENQEALFDATNTSLLGYTIYANPVTVGGVPLAYLGSDFAATETRSLVEEHIPEPWQDTATQVTGVVGGGTGFAIGMGITYTIGVAAGGETLIGIAIAGGPVTILAGAIGCALYQDYKLYRQLKETREHFLTQAPPAERHLFVGLCATLEINLEGELTHEKLQKIHDVISKEPYQSFLAQHGQHFVDAYLDPLISKYTSVPGASPVMLLPLLLASDVGSPSSEPTHNYTMNLGLIRDEILRPYADEWSAEIYRYTDPLTGLPSMIEPSGVFQPAAKKSETTMVSTATPERVGFKPTPTQKPYTTDSAEPRLIYDMTKEGEGIYAELVKEYPFEQRHLSLKISDTCKKLHADGKYTIAAEILNRWVQDAQKIVSDSQTSYSAAFKKATTFTNPFTGATFEGFSPAGVIDDEESRDLTMNHFLPFEEQIARYAHGDIADISEVLTKLNELAAKMAAALGWDLWKDLL